MSSKGIHQLAIDCFCTALGRSVSIEADALFSAVDDWDSLKQVELMFVVEDETGVIMNPDQLSSIVDLNSLMAVLEAIKSAQ